MDGDERDNRGRCEQFLLQSVLCLREDSLGQQQRLRILRFQGIQSGHNWVQACLSHPSFDCERDGGFVVICFDRAARVLFGCSADEFFDFVKRNPFAGMAAGKVLEGELFRMTLSKPKNGNAQHLRVASIVPLRPDFKPAIVALRRLYG
ncbi:hypothetical protein Scep_005173 [Stephania cephalantha]|uniref:Uncharacterized protein n=1 Tax=Stephania cephalantha TaxID=152367 RepID=A0AAP0KVE8_9MAGN